MKKKILSVLSFLWKIFIPLFSAVIGLETVERFNLIQIFGIITDTDKAFDICTTVYFAIVDVILLSATDWIKHTFFPTQVIRVTFSKPGDVVQIGSVTDLLLKEKIPTEAKVTVEINATKKICKGLTLRIAGVNFATMQLPAVSTVANVDESGNYIIDLEKMFGNQEIAHTTQSFRILFLKEPSNGACQSELYTKLSKEPWLLTFLDNKMIIRTEE